MTTYVLRDGRLVEKSKAPDKRGFTMRDDAEIKSQFDGKVYTSKAKYRAELKARGLIEVGNERREFEPRPPPPIDYEPAIARAMAQQRLNNNRRWR